MVYLRILLLASLFSALSACTLTQQTAAVFEVNGSTSEVSEPVIRDYALVSAKISIPRTLKVSEANMYYPMADIVWRGDAPGDRYAQIGSLFSDAVEMAKPALTGAVPVKIGVTLIRFHGVTEKTRSSVGGVYNILFTFTVRNAQTGEIIEPARVIEADLPAPGGQVAMLQDVMGQTERVRVTDFLAYVLVTELGGRATMPE